MKARWCEGKHREAAQGQELPCKWQLHHAGMLTSPTLREATVNPNQLYIVNVSTDANPFISRAEGPGFYESECIPLHSGVSMLHAILADTALLSQVPVLAILPV